MNYSVPNATAAAAAAGNACDNRGKNSTSPSISAVKLRHSVAKEHAKLVQAESSKLKKLLQAENAIAKEKERTKLEDAIKKVKEERLRKEKEDPKNEKVKDTYGTVPRIIIDEKEEQVLEDAAVEQEESIYRPTSGTIDMPESARATDEVAALMEPLSSSEQLHVINLALGDLLDIQDEETRKASNNLESFSLFEGTTMESSLVFMKANDELEKIVAIVEKRESKSPTNDNDTDNDNDDHGAIDDDVDDKDNFSKGLCLPASNRHEETKNIFASNKDDDDSDVQFNDQANNNDNDNGNILKERSKFSLFDKLQNLQRQFLECSTMNDGGGPPEADHHDNEETLEQPDDAQTKRTIINHQNVPINNGHNDKHLKSTRAKLQQQRL